MKTVVIWDDCEGDLRYFVTEEDVSGLDRKYVNLEDLSSEDEERITSLVYNSQGVVKIHMSKIFPVKEVRNGANVIVLGFAP